jgi:2-oxoglutarate ferredoxin oxidoreductase subunit beta
MDSLLNHQRPPTFCPGCSHTRMVKALDLALCGMGLEGHQVALVTDIGCAGLCDTFFNTHALHGLHGRALTYATGIKLAQPHLKVIAIMGDGGLGIGGTHLLAACRRNIDMTLLVLNNFNYGMTGGQCSATTPSHAQVASGFLNRLEKPMDVCQVAGAAGAAWLARCSAYQEDLVSVLQAAIAFDGFAIVDVWGICPGRYAKRNAITPRSIAARLVQLAPLDPFTRQNQRPEYGRTYRQAAANQLQAERPAQIAAVHKAPQDKRCEVMFLGDAGQRVVTAGFLLCMAGATAGWHATQKSDYPITVLQGHSVSEVILSPEPIDFTGIQRPTAIMALGSAGVLRGAAPIHQALPETIVLKAKDIELPETRAEVVEMDYRRKKVMSRDRALAALGWLAAQNRIVSRAMLITALEMHFTGAALTHAIETLNAIG